MPAPLQPWLNLEGSMTHAIAHHFGQAPQVEVHFSGADNLHVWEQQTFLPNAKLAAGYARHISLNIGERPVLLARSVTPDGSPVEALLCGLQTTPLARLLFEDAQWVRIGSPIALQASGHLFGRACLWQHLRDNGQLIVEEFFNF